MSISNRKRKTYIRKLKNPDLKRLECIIIEAAGYIGDSFNCIQINNYILDKYPDRKLHEGTVSRMLIEMTRGDNKALVITEKWKRGDGLYINGVTPTKYSLINK